MNGAVYRALAEALRPTHDLKTLRNARRAITDDGRPRLDRGAGNLPRGALVPLAAESVRTDPSSTSVADYLADQLQDVADQLVERSVSAVDTSSVNMTVAFNGTNDEVSADLIYAGSGGNFGLAATPARSDHAHSGVYQPAGSYAAAPLTNTASLNFPNIVAHTCEELTITVTGAAINQAVVLGPDDALSVGLIANGYVSAADTVTVRLCNITTADINPSAHTWRATVLP